MMFIYEKKKLCEGCFNETASYPCPVCGYRGTDINAVQAKLPVGTVLAGIYRVGNSLGSGGFGNTYLCFDIKHGRKVAVKEFFPLGIISRPSGSKAVTVTDSDMSGVFYDGRKKMLEEAENVAKFLGNPNIVGIYSSFEENNTAYYAMEYLEGKDLRKYILERGGKISVLEAAYILNKTFEALIIVHGMNLLHRDISPDNIFLCPNDQIKLIDFGSARQFTFEQSNSMSVVLKRGYAPKEQYSRRGKQGPWTDLYSLGATIFAAVSGYIPPDALEREEEPKLECPPELEKYPALFALLDKMMAPKADLRYKSALEAKGALDTLGLDKKAPAVTASVSAEVKPAAATISGSLPAPAKEKKKLRQIYIATVCVLATALIMIPGLTADKGELKNAAVYIPEEELLTEDNGDSTADTDAGTVSEAISETQAPDTKDSETVRQDDTAETGYTAAESVTLDRSSLSVTVGKSAALKASVSPSGSTDKISEWKSSDTSVAAVSGGTVRGISPGSVIIIVTTNNGKSASCKVTVTAQEAESVTLNTASCSLDVGTKLKNLTATVSPSDAADRSVTWSSSDSSVAKVETVSGSICNVTALKAGSVKITATTKNGRLGVCSITVNEVTVLKVIVDPTSLTLSEGDACTLKVTLQPGNVTDKNVTVTSSNNSVAKVSGFTVTAVSEGSATVTVTASNSVSATCAVTVKAVKVSSVSLSSASLELVTDDVVQLMASVQPSNAQNAAVAWSSSDTDVAEVTKEGYVIGLGKGSAIITAAAGGKTASCSVNVTSEYNAVKMGTTADGLEYLIRTDNTAVITGYEGTSKKVEIPSVIENCPVIKIGYNAFIKADFITDMIIPSSVISIGKYAFNKCILLQNIELPSSIKYIGYEAFFNCDSIKEITVPSSVIYIKGDAFDFCKNLSAINADINNLNYCSLDGVLFNKKMTEIVRYPIGKTNISYIIPSSVTIVGCYTFYSCDKLINIAMPSFITTIEKGAFYDCNSLMNIKLPSSLKSIGEHAFGRCQSLTDIEIPSLVVSIGHGCFYLCDSTYSVNVNNGNLNYSSKDGILFNKNCSELIYYPHSKKDVSYTIPSSVNKIIEVAFEGCDYLENINIPSSVTSIEKYAFESCDSVKNITIPYSVVNMGFCIFDDWTSSQTIKIEKRTSEPSTWDESWDYNCKAKILWNQ